jgi:NCS1 family nucleobase:cation symporter-1
MVDNSREGVAGQGVTKRERHVEGWILPKETSSFAPDGTWTNIDLDVVLPERRTWTSITIVGYWLSDIVRIFT